MSKKKSLGSSPIGYSMIGSSNSTFQFIPDLDASEEKESSTTSYSYSANTVKRNTEKEGVNSSGSNDDSNKKIASYYLEVGLINRLKIMADKEGTYYSTLVGEAIEHWVDIHGY